MDDARRAIPAVEREGPLQRDRIVAVSLLTEEELRNVRTGLKRIYPVPADSDFDDLLKAIDQMASGPR